jgi:hypothetical protein
VHARAHLIYEHDGAIRILPKLVLGVNQQQATLRGLQRGTSSVQVRVMTIVDQDS